MECYIKRDKHTQFQPYIQSMQQTLLDLSNSSCQNKNEVWCCSLGDSSSSSTTVNGHLPLNVQKALERFSSMQAEPVMGDPVVDTVKGHLPLNVLKALERFSSMKTESVGDAGIVATASNGTIESVLSELNMNRR